MDPSGKREQDQRRLTGLKVGAVAITVAGLGAFAGLAAAGTDDGPSPMPGTAAGASVTPSSSASDAARAAEDDAFFDEQAQRGAVGGYEGYDHDGDGDHHRGRGHHGAPPGAYGDDGADPAADSPGAQGAYGGQGSAPQSDMASGGGWGSSQGSTGGS